MNSITCKRIWRGIASSHGMRLVAILAAIFLVGDSVSAVEVDPTVLQAETQRVDLIERIAPAVVAIFSKDGQGGGSGVLISADGFTVTNFHVVDGQGPFLKCGLNDGRLYDAVLVGIDPTGDVALIQMQGRDDFPHAAIGDSDKVQVGDATYAMGNPFLLATDFKPTVTYGMVSGVHRYQFPAGTFLEYTDCLQVDTSINPGNSGGPLFNAAGELIGINGRISVEKRGRVNVGAGYSISINQVMNFLDHLKSGRIVDHATLGAVVATNSDGSVTVSNILEQSEAFRRGLQVGDELVSFAGRPITTANQFKNVLGIYPAGWKLPLTYRRKDQNVEILVRLRRLHRLAELQMPGEEKSPPPGPPRGEQPPPPDAKAVDSGPSAELKRMFIERSGYANYWYNQQRQEHLLNVIKDWGDYSAVKGRWDINGRLDGKTPVQFRITDKTAAVKVGDRASVQQAGDPLTDQPPETGGWLPAMQLLRQALIGGREAFSDIYYLGSEPLDGVGPRVDVLVTLRGQSTLRWYIRQDLSACVGVDFQLEEDADACEIRFGALKDFEGRKFPSAMTIHFAAQRVGEFAIEAFTASPAGAAD